MNEDGIEWEYSWNYKFFLFVVNHEELFCLEDIVVEIEVINIKLIHILDETVHAVKT